ncbi:MAG: hypothetical protein ABII12_12135 [Planctomycetota bacterium]
MKCVALGGRKTYRPALHISTGVHIYLIGWRYTEKECPQIVFDATFVRSEEGSVCITVKKLIDNTVPGLSGSPVIDDKGRGKGDITGMALPWSTAVLSVTYVFPSASRSSSRGPCMSG